MKTIRLFMTWLLFLGVVAGGEATAADNPADPTISLTVKNEPLGEVLDNITADTGYQFKLNSKWETWPVSATIVNLPLEQGLKRLLRSLNHTIIWEADQRITIMVYGKAETGARGGAVSHAAPPQSVLEAPSPDFESQIEAAGQGISDDENRDVAQGDTETDVAEAQAEEIEADGETSPNRAQAPRTTTDPDPGDDDVEEPAPGD